MGEGGCHSSREGAVIWEDAVYQGRELFFEGEEMFFKKGSCSLGGQMLFINEGQKHCPLMEGCPSLMGDSECCSLRKGRTSFIKGGSCLSTGEGGTLLQGAGH